jgi:hypothetical protein
MKAATPRWLISPKGRNWFFSPQSMSLMAKLSG